jgi:phosphoglycerol transferase MdoB-like AlkP superfamily enzyme
MKIRLKFLLVYFVFWLLLFMLGRIVFLLYQHSQSFPLPFADWISICVHGFRLDLSAAGYFTMVPVLVMMLTAWLNYKLPYYIINTYTAIMIVVFLLITLVDLEVYKYWGSRLDSAPMRFLNKPEEVLASSSFITLILYFVSLLLFCWVLFWSYLSLVASNLKKSGKSGIPGLLAFTLLAALLFLPIRGGIGVSAINTGSAYFSKNAFANHAAVNGIWNFGHSLVEGQESDNPYVFNANKDFDKDLKKLFTSQDGPSQVLNTKRPNILLIIMETFSAKLIEPLGGAKGVTPNFNELSKHGVLFSNIYSSDSRTDKGLATVLSGYPVLEAIPILRYPEKTQHLPFLSKSLINNGYHASFLYGGDVEFANMRSYLVNGNFAEITSGSAFPASMRSGKWGVPDHLLFTRFLEDIKADTGSWFKVVLTLSNHEPFQIPGKPRYGNNNLADKFYSSAYYADSCLGSFIRQLKETGLWKNTVVIMVADHGTRLPEFCQVYEPRKHHIPLLFTGGAVIKDTVVTKFGSQADLAITLLHQLNISTSEYVLGKDLLSASSQSFACYSYKNGIAMVTDSSGFGYDFTNNALSYSYGRIDKTHVQLARLFQQFVFENYLRLADK